MDEMWNEFEGRTVDGHTLTSFLGVRGDRAFYIAESTTSPRAVLMQVMLSSSPGALAQLDRWARASKLTHKNLMQVYSTGEDLLGDTPIVYATLEMPDDDLSEILPQRTLKEIEVRPIVAACASALEHLHRHGFAHSAVRPDSIFAVGEEIKLGVDTIHTADPGSAHAADLHGLGATVVEMFIGRRVRDLREIGGTELDPIPAPFRQIAIGCLSQELGEPWTATRVLAVLSGRADTAKVTPAPDKVAPVKTAAPLPPVAATTAAAATPVPPLPRSTPPRDLDPVATESRSSGAVWMWVAAAVFVLCLCIYLFTRKSTPAPPAAARPAPATPAPASTSTQPAAIREKAVEGAKQSSKPMAAKPARARSAEGNWAVVAATYNSYAGSRKRAQSLKQKWPAFSPEVFPDEGKGKQYFVILGSGLSKQSAEALRRRAKAGGFPGDTYVTKLLAP
jgi:hypothetical protein